MIFNVLGKKIKLIILLILPFIFFSFENLAREISQKEDQSINQTDSNGLKQGHWKKYYENGDIKYDGFFKDNRPVGEFKRYYPGNNLKTSMFYKKDGRTVYSKFYYQNGKRAAEGKFSGEKKDSIWKYFSYYEGHLSFIEDYKDGKKNGFTLKYYDNGTINEKTCWKDGVKEGKWTRYYKNGNIVLTSTYQNGKLHGNYEAFYPDGETKVKGKYIKDRRQGKWVYYDKEGKINLTLKYNNGQLLNKDDMNEYEKKIFEQFEKEKGNTEDPDNPDFILN